MPRIQALGLCMQKASATTLLSNCIMQEGSWIEVGLWMLVSVMGRLRVTEIWLEVIIGCKVQHLQVAAISIICLLGPTTNIGTSNCVYLSCLAAN